MCTYGVHAVYVCVRAHMYGHLPTYVGQKRVLGHLELGLLVIMGCREWVLGAESGASGRKSSKLS